MNTARNAAINADFVESCRHADWARAIALIDDHWLHLAFDRETYQLFFTTITTAPEDLIRSTPTTSLAAEVVGRLPVGSTAVDLPTTPARIGDAVRGGQARRLLEQATHALIGHRVAGAFTEGLQLVADSRPLLAVSLTTRFSPAADLAAYWHLQAGQLALQANELTTAREDLERAWHFHITDVTGYVAPSAAPLLALLAVLNDSPTEYDRWRRAHQELIEDTTETLIEADTMARPLLLCSLLLPGGASGVGESSAPTADLARTLSTQWAFDELWSLTLYALVRHALAAEDLDGARYLVDAALTARGRPPERESLHGTFLAAARAEISLASDSPSQARRDLPTVTASRLPALLQILDQRITAALAEANAGVTPLTAGEIRALERLGNPGTLRQVAQEMHVSINTLKTHLRSLYEKLGVSSRAEAVERARDLHLID